jgi:hypothetical protein
MRPAHSASTRAQPLSLMLRVSHLCKLWHSSVKPIVSQAGYNQTLSKISDEYQQLLAESLPLPRDLVDNYPDSSSLMSQEAPLHPLASPAAVRACVEQQAACILGHLCHASDLSLLNDPPGILSHRANNTGLVALINEHNLSDTSTALSNSLHGQKAGVRKRCSMQRTMLTCEGIAINCLFDHGRSTSRVGFSRSSTSQRSFRKQGSQIEALMGKQLDTFKNACRLPRSHSGATSRSLKLS